MECHEWREIYYLDQLRNAAGLLPRVDAGENLGGVGGGDAAEDDGDGHRVHDFN